MSTHFNHNSPLNTAFERIESLLSDAEKIRSPNNSIELLQSLQTIQDQIRQLKESNPTMSAKFSVSHLKTNMANNHFNKGLKYLGAAILVIAIAVGIFLLGISAAYAGTVLAVALPVLSFITFFVGLHRFDLVRREFTQYFKIKQMENIDFSKEFHFENVRDTSLDSNRIESIDQRLQTLKNTYKELFRQRSNRNKTLLNHSLETPFFNQ